MDNEVEEAPHLPAEVVKKISGFCLDGEPNPASRLLLLLSMCGVCKSWRQMCSEVAAGVTLAFDGMESAPPAPGGMMMTRFRRTPAWKKTAVFEAAAKLLTGYADVSLSGDCVTDAALAALASANGPRLASLRLQSAGRVTDEGLATLLAAAPRLRHLHLSELGPQVAGSFLPALLGSCRQLASVHVSGAPGLDWGAMDWARAAPGPAPAPAGAVGAEGVPPAAAVCRALRVAAPEAPGGDAAGARGGGADLDAGGASADASSEAAGPSTSGEQLPWPASLGAIAAPSSSARGPALSPPASPMQQHQQQSPLSAGGHAPPAGGHGRDAAAGEGGQGAGARGVPSISSSGSLVGGAGGRGAAAAAASPAAAAAPPPPPAAAAPPPTAATTARQPPAAASVSRLHVRSARLDGLPRLLALLPNLSELELDGPAINIQFAAVTCPNLRRLSYLVESPQDLDEALWSFTGLSGLRALEVVAKGPLILPDQLRVLGMLPLTELRLDSWAYKQQPTLSRPAFSHVSNDGVKALVDAVCARMAGAREASPLKLSLAGATTINHEAVSALLRLPVLTELDIAGCSKISPMDKMRLVAKVKAGREFLRARP